MCFTCLSNLFTCLGQDINWYGHFVLVLGQQTLLKDSFGDETKN